MPRKSLAYLIALLFCLCFPATGMAQGHYLDWSAQTSLPTAGEKGLSAPFSGVHGDVLLVAGGAREVERDSLEPTVNIFSDIYVGSKAENGRIAWQSGPELQLEQPLAYGISVTTPQGLLCIGGRDADGPIAEVRLLQWDATARKVRIKPLASLPAPVSHGAGALMNGKIYLYGARPESDTSYFFRLDLSASGSQWESLPPCPGPPRQWASAAVQSDGRGEYFYLFGGRCTAPSCYLLPQRDAWRFDPVSGSWTAISDMGVQRPSSGPGPLYALADDLMGPQRYFAVSAPAIDAGVHHILVFGAQSGGDLDTGLPRREILAYHTVTDTWTVVDTVPAGLPVNTTASWWDGDIVLPTGTPPPGQQGATLMVFTPQPAPSGLRWLDFAVIVLYLAILVWMGAHFMRRGKTTEDYFKAGKRIPWWAAGISIFGTSLSAITYMAVPAKAYGTDWTYTFLSVSQILTVPLVIWLVLPFYRRLNVTTAYEYLERRFHVVVRLIGGLAFILFQFGRIGIVLFLPAIALSVVTGVDIYSCIIVMAVLSIFYTVLGGIEAVIWTDVKQVVVLTIGAVVCLGLMINGTPGGLDHMVDLAAGDGKLKLWDLDFDFHSPTLWVILGGGIGTNLINQTSDQTFVQRYLTTRDERSAARGLLTPAFLVIPVSLLFFGLGTALYTFFKTNPAALNPVLENADAIFPWYIVSQLPQGLSGLLIAGIFAASMSSLDSSLNSAATVITVDFYKRFKPRAADQHYLSVARVVTVVIGVVGMGFALLMAGYEIKSLWDEFSKLLGLFAGGLAGLFLLGMSSRRATTGGALIGFGVSAAIQYWVSSTAAVHFLLYTFTGLASCYVVGWLASWLFPRRRDLFGLTIGTIRQVQENETATQSTDL